MDNLAEWIGAAVTFVGIFFVFISFVANRPTREEVSKMIELQVAPLRDLITVMNRKLDSINSQVSLNTGIIKKIDESIYACNEGIKELKDDIRTIAENYVTKSDCRFTQDKER